MSGRWKRGRTKPRRVVEGGFWVRHLHQPDRILLVACPDNILLPHSSELRFAELTTTTGLICRLLGMDLGLIGYRWKWLGGSGGSLAWNSVPHLPATNLPSLALPGYIRQFCSDGGQPALDLGGFELPAVPPVRVAGRAIKKPSPAPTNAMWPSWFRSKKREPRRISWW